MVPRLHSKKKKTETVESTNNNRRKRRNLACWCLQLIVRRFFKYIFLKSKLDRLCIFHHSFKIIKAGE